MTVVRGARPVPRPGSSALAPRRGVDRRALLSVLFAFGAMLMPAGLVVMLLGWWGAARTPHTYQQWAYLISGGMLGLALLFLGGMLFLGAWFATLSANRHERRETLAERIDQLARVMLPADELARSSARATRLRQVAAPVQKVIRLGTGAPGGVAAGTAASVAAGSAAAVVPPGGDGPVVVPAGDGAGDGGAGGGLPPKRRLRDEITKREVGMILLLAMTAELVAFEITLVNPGLPEIAAAFDIEAVHWVLTVLFVVSAATVPVTGRIADSWGKKRVLLACLACYVLGSALCAVTSSYALFLVGRGLQAIMLAGPAIAFALVRDLLKPSVVPLAVGGILAGSGMSAIVGPVLGGVLVQLVSYQAPFWFLAGYGVLLFALLMLMPEGRVEEGGLRLDWVAAGLLTAGTVLVTVGLELPIWLLVPGVLLGFGSYWAFVRRCLGQGDPLIDVRLMYGYAMRMTLLVGACGGTFMASIPFLLPSLLRPHPTAEVAGLGLTPIQMGLLYGLPLGLANCVAAFSGGVISRRRSPRRAAQLGMGCMLASGLGYAVLAAGAPKGLIVFAAMTTGLGIGLFLSSTAILVVEAVPAEKHGSSAGVKYTWEAIFSGIGIALAAALMRPGLVAGEVGSEGESTAAYTTPGLLTGFVLITLIAAAGLWLATIMRHGRVAATGGGVPAGH